MALIKCPECGKEISDKAEFCPNCGYKPNSIKDNLASVIADDSENRKKPIIKWYVICGILVIIGIVLYFATGDIRKKANDKQPPEFTNLTNQISVQVGDEIDFKEWLNENKVEAIDNVTENIKINIDNSEIDFNVPGTYYVTLTAIDEADNIAKERIKVVVNDYPTHKAYEDATNLTIDDLKKDASGAYWFNDIHISSKDVEEQLEDGAIYRSIAKQIVGYYIGGEEFYNMWGNEVLPIISGFEKKATWTEMRPYMDEISLFISEQPALGELMSRFQRMNVVEGNFDYKNGQFSFVISDLTEAAKELKITEEMLGYILAMLEEYAPKTEFVNNSYRCELEFLGKRGIDKSDFYYYSWDQKSNVLDEIVGQGYVYFCTYDANVYSVEETFGFFTNRGIQLEHSIDTVIFNHAGGEVKNLKRKEDIIYNVLAQNSDDSCKILEKCNKYIAYAVKGKGNNIYYFDDDSRLMFIAYTNVILY